MWGEHRPPLRAAIATFWLLLALAAQTHAQEVPMPVAGQVPTWIDIPKTGTHASVIAVAREPDGTMQAPTDPDVVGWYDLGTGLGAPGNALLDGHVDWGGRLRVFGLLRQLGPGDTFRITDVGGNVYSYEVSWTRLYDTDAAPLDEILGPTTDEVVTLITCGGTFDPTSRM